MPDANPDPIVFGQRMQILRERRGMTRTVLAGLVGMSPSWVKCVESGQLRAPRLEMVLRIAQALRVRDLADLTGAAIRAPLFGGPGHPRLAAVAASLDNWPTDTGHEPPPTGHLRSRLSRAWASRHSSPNHREVIGALLPDLIRDALMAARHTETAVDRRAGQALVSEVYALAQFFLAYQPDPTLLWRVAERGMVTAQESEDPHTIGVASWLMAEAHRDSGPAGYDAADAVTRNALDHLNPLLPDATDDVLAVVGALRTATAYTAARRGEKGTAWRHWDTAERIARRLPQDYYHPVTSFSRAVMGAHALTVAVELGSGPESARQAAQAHASAIRSRPRKARHQIEQARGYQLNGQPDAALATLKKAYEAAPETIRYNGYARRIVVEEAESNVTTRRRRASALAVDIGMLAV